MKETLVNLLNTLLVVVLALLIITGYGFIAINLGMKIPYYLFQQGHWGFAIAQLVIVWTWLLGGSRK